MARLIRMDVMIEVWTYPVVDGAKDLEFHQLRKVLDNIRRICEVELTQ